MYETELPEIEYADRRHPDMRQFLKLAGYEINRTHSQLNQGRKDELFTDALVFDKNIGTDAQDSFFARKDGTVLDFNTYTWVPWLRHPDMMKSAENLGLVKVTKGSKGSKIELDSKAFRRKGLKLNGDI